MNNPRNGKCQWSQKLLPFWVSHYSASYNPVWIMSTISSRAVFTTHKSRRPALCPQTGEVHGVVDWWEEIGSGWITHVLFARETFRVAARSYLLTGRREPDTGYRADWAIWPACAAVGVLLVLWKKWVSSTGKRFRNWTPEDAILSKTRKQW